MLLAQQAPHHLLVQVLVALPQRLAARREVEVDYVKEAAARHLSVPALVEAHACRAVRQPRGAGAVQVALRPGQHARRGNNERLAQVHHLDHQILQTAHVWCANVANARLVLSQQAPRVRLAMYSLRSRAATPFAIVAESASILAILCLKFSIASIESALASLRVSSARNFPNSLSTSWMHGSCATKYESHALLL